LGLAFLERIAQALEGRSASGPLPDVLRLHLTAADPLTRSAINRYRGASRVLEPFERFDAFGWNQQSLRADDLPALAAAALGLGEPAAVIARFTELLEMHPSPGSQTALVSAALTAAPRLGEGFAVDLLKRATRAALQCRPDEELYRVVGMLEGALSTAGYFGRDDAVPDLVRALTDVFAYTDPVRVGWLVAQADVQGFRVLARLGRAEDVGRLIRATATNILRAQDLPGAREAWGSNWPVVLPGLLYVAGGWFYLGESEAASEVLEEARTLLLRRTLSTQGQARLTAAYARALGQAPPEVALPRMGELLTRLDRLTPEGGPGWGWSEQMVEWRVLESVVLAAVSDDFTAGTEVRRWLDEDEYLVRRRVHRSVRRALASG
jgi:hypothetical protein